MPKKLSGGVPYIGNCTDRYSVTMGRLDVQNWPMMLGNDHEQCR